MLDYLDRGGQEPFFLFIHYYDVHSPYSEPNPYGASFEQEISTETNAVMVRLRSLDGRRIGDLAPEDRNWITARFPDSGPAHAIRAGGAEGRLITYKDIQTMAYAWLRKAGPAVMAPVKGAYDNGVAYLDHRLSELFQRLETFPWFGRTLFVITGDHGEAFGEHGGVLGHGGPPYEELSRVPLIVFGKGVRQGVRVKAPVGVIDIAPTLLDVVGIDPPSSFQGVSFLPLLRGEGMTRDRPLLSGVLDTGRAAIREGRWKLVLEKGDGAGRLYDLLSREGETKDRAPAFPELAARLKENLQKAERYNRMLVDGLKAETVILTEESRARLRELGYLK